MKALKFDLQVWINTDLPKKDESILVEQLDGSYSIQKAHKDLTSRDCYVESSRMVFPIVKTELIRK